MLKFQDNNTTVIETFEDFILTVYVMIDELYHRFAPPKVINRCHILDVKLSDPKIISICGELAGIDSENAWYSFIKRNYCHLFPTICSRSRFIKDKARSAPNNGTATAKDTLCLPDSKQQVFCSGQLLSFRGYGADYGKCSSKKETYFGYKVHALVILERYMTAFEITPASVDD